MITKLIETFFEINFVFFHYFIQNFSYFNYNFYYFTEECFITNFIKFATYFDSNFDLYINLKTFFSSVQFSLN